MSPGSVYTAMRGAAKKIGTTGRGQTPARGEQRHYMAA
jgi:hypothetical protein